MALSGTFEADFSSFYAAVDTANVKLREFESGAGTVETRLSRMVDTFSGRKVIQDATLMTEAIERLGGASELTEAELARVGKTVGEAVEKMRALGMDVPQSMQDLAAAAKSASTETESLTGTIGGMVAAYVSVEAVLKLAGAAWDALVSTMKAAIAAAGEAEDADAALNAALAAQGNAVPAVTSAYQGYAAALQQTTRYSDDALTAAEAVLAQLGNVGPAEMQKALEATTKLAAGMRIDLTSAATMVAKAAEGQTTALRKAGVLVDETAAKTGNFGLVLDAINAKFVDTAEIMGNTFTGRIAKMGNAWDNVLESIGRVVTTNDTLRTALGGVTDLLTAQTTELNTNAGAEKIVSAAVIVTVDAMDLLVKGLDLAVGYFADYQKRQAESAVTMLDWARAALEAAKAVESIRAALPGAIGEQAQHQVEQYEGAIIAAAFKQQELRQSIVDTASAATDWHARLGALDSGLQSLSGRLETTRGQTTAAADASHGLAAGFEQVTMTAASMFGGEAVTGADALTKAVKAQLDALIELNAAGATWTDTLRTMDGALVQTIRDHLEAGRSQATIATAYGVTATQVKAVAEMIKAEGEAAKQASAEHAIIAKLQADYYKTLGALSADTTGAQIADIHATERAQIAALEHQKVTAQEAYDLVAKISAQAQANVIQGELEADAHTEAHYQKLAAEAEVAYRFAMAHADQYTQAELTALGTASDAATAAAANWIQVEDALDQTTAAAGRTSAAMQVIGDTYQSVMGLAGTGGNIPGGGKSSVTPWYDAQPGRTMSYQTMLINKSYQESGLATAPVTVNVQSGAVQQQYPIMNDPGAMASLARTVGDAIVQRLTGSGFRA